MLIRENARRRRSLIRRARGLSWVEVKVVALATFERLAANAVRAPEGPETERIAPG